MLDPNYLLHISEGAEDIAEKLHNQIVKRIVERIMLRIGRGDDYILTAQDKWQIQTLQDAGFLLEDIQKDIAQATKLQQTEIAEAMEDAGVKALSYDDRIYREAGITTVPLTESPQLIRLMQRNYDATIGEWTNFTRTTADAAQRLFVNELDRAYNLVATGAMSYTQAVKDVVKNIVSNGVEVVWKNDKGEITHKDTIETATLRAVRTGISQASAQIQIARMDEYDVDLVITSSHLGARPSHQVWQGQIFSRSGKGKYPDFVESTGYGSVSGLCGANCRHSFSPYFEGMDNPYDKFDSEENKKQYETEQYQRTLERRIRHTKRETMGLKEAVDSCKDDKLKFELDLEYQKKASLLMKQNTAYNEFCESNNLKRRSDRIQIAKWDRQQAAAARGAAKRYENAKGGSVANRRLNKVNSDGKINLKERISNADADILSFKKQFSDLTDGYSYDEWFKDFKSIEEGYGEVSDSDETFEKLKTLDSKIKDTTKKKTELLRQKDKRKQLDTGYSGKVPDEEIDSFNAKALGQIKLDTSYSDEKAREFQKALQEYFGGDYETILSGETPTAKTIRSGIERMPVYDGSISRGMIFDNADVKAFTNLQIGDKIPQKGIIESWSSEQGTSIAFSGISDYRRSSVILECMDNETAVGVQHLSSFGSVESEVLSSAKYEVVEVITESKYDYLSRHKEYLYSPDDLEEEELYLKENVVCIIKVKEKN